MIGFKYDTYQDVRKNLFTYSIPFFIVAGFMTFNYVFPQSLQKTILFFVENNIKQQNWQYIIKGGIGSVIFIIIAFLFTEIFQLHDQFYDKFIIKWRKGYAIDFIQIRLIQPFSNRLNYRFFEELNKNVGQFQERLFYPFVGDRDHKISKNKLIRFYEAITPYWLTQTNEILFVIIILVSIFIHIFIEKPYTHSSVLTTSITVLLVLFVLNRIWRNRIIKRVRSATYDEIKSIHEDEELLKELELKLKTLCKDYNVPYND